MGLGVFRSSRPPGHPCPPGLPEPTHPAQLGPATLPSPSLDLTLEPPWLIPLVLSPLCPTPGTKPHLQMIPTSLPPWAARPGHTPVLRSCPRAKGLMIPLQTPFGSTQALRLWGQSADQVPKRAHRGHQRLPSADREEASVVSGLDPWASGHWCSGLHSPDPVTQMSLSVPWARTAEARLGCDEEGARSGLGWGVTPGKRGLHQSPLAQEEGPGPVCGLPQSRSVTSGRKREEGHRRRFLRSDTNAFAMGAKIRQDFTKSKARAAFAST